MLEFIFGLAVGAFMGVFIISLLSINNYGKDRK
jgi:hypothetical protein